MSQQENTRIAQELDSACAERQECLGESRSGDRGDGGDVRVPVHAAAASSMTAVLNSST